ncbi:hypothetical protein SH661x_000741 [Planctomicrobium sp. SH661]|uniref:hypothetical protein n=1 Tax=Planctomicrobium sp. SH661 TaxID=3448124 RepID=UPI003F5C184A
MPSTSDDSSRFPAGMALSLASSMTLIAVIAAGTFWAAASWLGRPSLKYFTLTPTPFFLSSLLLVATGGFLGFARLSKSRRRMRIFLTLCLTCGSLLLAMQSYGLWCLMPGRFTAASSSFRVAMTLAAGHLMGCLLLLILISLAFAVLFNQPEKSEVRHLLKICALYWYALGFLWTGLMCAFSMMLS